MHEDKSLELWFMVSLRLWLWLGLGIGQGRGQSYGEGYVGLSDLQLQCLEVRLSDF